jgi:protein-S-isoprenylcysteine O-methyltransferase Ste14
MSEVTSLAATAPMASWKSALPWLRDLLIRAFVGLWFLLQAANFVREMTIILAKAGPLTRGDYIHLLSEVSLFLFFIVMACLTVLRSRPVAQAPGVWPRLSALLGAYLLYALPLLAHNRELGTGGRLVSSLLLIGGDVAAVLILFRLGKSFSIMAEARRLVTRGPYAFVRHPLYLAEQIALLGAIMQYDLLPAGCLYAAQFAFQIQRMRNEEKILQASFPEYRAYMARTARLVPGIW